MKNTTDLNVASFDFDGCLYNDAYHDKGRDIVFANKNFLDTIKYRYHLTMIGSARQSYNQDLFNSQENQTGLASIDIEAINAYLNTKTCDFLMADITHLQFNQHPGYCQFDLSQYAAQGCDTSGYNFYDWDFDESKFTLLYAQMHHIASDNQDKSSIIFDFYDDRNEDILPGLGYIFSRLPWLLPHNLTLNLYHYCGNKVTRLSSIQGAGNIDLNYKSTVVRMQKHVKSFIEDNMLDTNIWSERKLAILLYNKYFGDVNIPYNDFGLVQLLAKPVSSDAHKPSVNVVTLESIEPCISDEELMVETNTPNGVGDVLSPFVEQNSSAKSEPVDALPFSGLKISPNSAFSKPIKKKHSNPTNSTLVRR
jgi:hypothetical protein